MPNLAGQVLPYIKGLASSAKGMGSRFIQAGRDVGMGRSLFQNRTALGAIGGAAYGAYSGQDYSLARMGMYAGIGAMGARYGGAMARGSNRYAGMGFAARRAGAMRAGRAVGSMDVKGASIAAIMSSRFIGNTLTKGYGRIKSTLGRGSMLGL